MAERDWFEEATARALRGESWQLTFWSQREAKRVMCEYIGFLHDVGIAGWKATWANGNLSVAFENGGRLWFETFRHGPRPGIREWFHGEDAPPIRKTPLEERITSRRSHRGLLF